jgi:hypothetical protein
VPELAGEGAGVHVEVRSDVLERQTLSILICRLLYVSVGQLPDVPSALDAASVEVADDRGAVDGVVGGQFVER